MQSALVKLQSRQAMLGYYARSVALLLLLTAGGILWGVFTRAARYLLDSQQVSGSLYALWDKLPALTGFLGALTLLLLAAFFLSPLRLGCAAWFLGGALKKRRSGKWILYWLKPGRAAKATRFQLAIGLRRALLLTAFLLPGAFLLAGAFYGLLYDGAARNVFFTVVAAGAVLTLLGLFFGSAALQRYFLAPFLLARYPALQPREALRKSIVIMDEHCLQALLFKLSFSPWFLLCLLVFPVFYVWPYYQQACAVWAKNLQESWEEEQTALEEESFHL